MKKNSSIYYIVPHSALKKDDSRMFLFFPHITFQHILHFPVVKALAQLCRSHCCSKTAARDSSSPGAQAQLLLSLPSQGHGLRCPSGTLQWESCCNELHTFGHQLMAKSAQPFWFTADCTTQLPSTIRSSELAFLSKCFSFINLLLPCILLCYQRAQIVLTSTKNVRRNYTIVRW